MSNVEIIILSLSISFCVTQIWKPFKFKPFNCMMCLTGWCALFISFMLYFHIGILVVPVSMAFLYVGCFIGAIVDAAMNKYL